MRALRLPGRSGPDSGTSQLSSQYVSPSRTSPSRPADVRRSGRGPVPARGCSVWTGQARPSAQHSGPPSGSAVTIALQRRAPPAQPGSSAWPFLRPTDGPGPKLCYPPNIVAHWGHSSAGRAPALQAGGRRFEPAWLHYRKLKPYLDPTVRVGPFVFRSLPFERTQDAGCQLPGDAFRGPPASRSRRPAGDTSASSCASSRRRAPEVL